jgi:uncharacterized membrane protein HdeD (DUF308 family)
MPDDLESRASSDRSALPSESSRVALASHWGLVLAGGTVALLLGAALAAWPGETTAVLAYLLAIQFIIAGGLQMILAFATAEGAARWAGLIVGALCLGAGGLFLLNPLQTLTFIGWAVGICVIAVGVTDLFGALLTPARPHRGWQVVRGMFGILIGGYLVANPDKSLAALVVVAYVWLIAYGFITIVAALSLRSENSRRQVQSPAADGRPSST